jgi:U3 small nucleolar RNA-associated protein 22
MRMQIDELHSNISPAYEKLRKVDQFVEKVRSAISGVKSTEIAVQSASKYALISLRGALLTPVQFSAPTASHVVGSYSEKSMVKPLQVIDLLVTLPADVFGPKDMKSYRFFDRRSVYVAELESQVRASLPDMDVSILPFRFDLLKPVIRVGIPGSQWEVRVIPVVSPDTFSHDKLTPDYKNLNESTDSDPFYNSSILEDMWMVESDKLVASVAVKYQNWARAVQLVKVWLYRRGSLLHANSSIALSGFEIRSLLAHICASQSLPREVSAYQLFKLFLTQLVKTNWRESLLTYGSGVGSANTYNSSMVVLQCPSMNNYNVLWRIPVGLMEELASEAVASLAILDDSEITDPYESLFSPISRPHDFEVVIESTDNGTQFVNRMIHVFRTGLGNRLFRNLLSVRGDGMKVTISGSIDGTSLANMVDKGPSADSKDAVAWKKFWGSKSELRRFKDGSILECVVWKKDGSAVAQQVMEYLLPFHGITKFHVSVSPLASGLVGVSHVTLWTALESLRSKLGNVSTPIRILDLKSVHARFTGTDLSSSSLLAPLDCVIEFESSPAWPIDSLALWHTKCAFLLAVREGLMKQYCSVEVSAEELSEDPFIDVRAVGENFAFRLRIFAQSEILKFNSQMESIDNPPSAIDVSRMSSLYFSPALRGRVHALSPECPALAGAIIAAKSWMDNHLLLEPWLNDWVEMTVAYVVGIRKIRSADAGQSAHVAFLEWLFFIGQHSFKNPVFMSEWDDNGSGELVLNFENAVEARKSVWWISSPIDPHCVFLRRPNEWEAVRIQSLAKKACEHATKKNWTLITNGTDNSAVFDMLIEVGENEESSTNLADVCKVLNEQFRNLITFRFSKRHGIIGGILQPSGFVTGGDAKASPMHCVVGGLCMPDFPHIVEKMQKLLEGIKINNITIR